MRVYFTRLLSLYNQCLEKRPFTTQGLSACFLYATGDFMCQIIEKKKFTLDLDYKRIFRMAMYGTFVFAPISHLWYLNLDKRIIVTKRNKFKQISKKVLLDEFVFTPIVLLAFFSTLTTFEHLMNKYEKKKNEEEIKTIDNDLFYKITHKLKDDYVNTFLVDMAVWPPLQYFNFYFIPGVYRVLYINVCCIFWNAFLSMQQHKH
ncbi:hypothetical protein ABK040_014064 [Willaertia magna]